MSLEIQEQDKDGITLLELKGSLDAGSVSNLGEKVKQLEQQNKNKLVLLMEELEFISSAGWSVFIELSKDLRAAKGDLRLAEMQRTAGRIFDLMGLDAWIKTYPSADEAVKSYME